jgi:predicted GNAT family acetyltransferase
MATRVAMRPLLAGVVALLWSLSTGDADAARTTARERTARKPGGERRASRAATRPRAARSYRPLATGRAADVKRPAMTELVRGLEVENELPVGTGEGNFVYKDRRGLAELTYVIRRKNTVVYLTHTGVRGELKGQGAGKRLVEEAVVWAAREGLKVVPHCEFARREFDKAKERGDTRYAAVEFER